jgi:hypothetical protein
VRRRRTGYRQHSRGRAYRIIPRRTFPTADDEGRFRQLVRAHTDGHERMHLTDSSARLSGAPSAAHIDGSVRTSIPETAMISANDGRDQSAADE